MCAIWLLGTILPLAFLTTFGDASEVGLADAAIESMAAGCEVVVKLELVRTQTYMA